MIYKCVYYLLLLIHFIKKLMSHLIKLDAGIVCDINNNNNNSNNDINFINIMTCCDILDNCKPIRFRIALIKIYRSTEKIDTQCYIRADI